MVKTSVKKMNRLDLFHNWVILNQHMRLARDHFMMRHSSMPHIDHTDLLDKSDDFD